MSATSSRLTTPSQSRSSIWKPSRSVRTCAGCSWASAVPLASDLEAVDEADRRLCSGAMGSAGVCALGVQLSCERVLLGVVGRANLPAAGLVGDAEGVVCRSGDGEAGDSGRRKGELREGGEP